MKKIAYYISAHGYGHGTRSCDIIAALHAAAPDITIIVKTDLPAEFMSSRLPPEIDIRPGAYDLGLIQTDSIRVDLKASLEAIEKLYACEEKLVAQENEFIQSENVGLVVTDIPAIPLAAAQRVGIPNIACSNFGWDWIYSEFVEHDPRWQIYVDKFSAVYKKTDLLLRLPFSEPMSIFPFQIDLPLLAKPGKKRRELIADATGADLNKEWILFSFTTLDLDSPALENLARVSEYELFSVEPLKWPNTSIHSISLSTASFADILASVDMVVTKPGFGIVSECIVNNKPIIYSDRKNFKEYPILVEAIETYCRQVFLPNEKLYKGELKSALREMEFAPAPKKNITNGGAEIAAKEILTQFNAIR